MGGASGGAATGTSAAYIVDTPAGLALAASAGGSEVIAITDNPILGRQPRPGRHPPLIDASAFLDQDEAVRMGHAVTDALLALDAALLASDYARTIGLPTARLNVAMALRATATALLQRGAMIERAIDSLPTPPSTIGIVGDLSRRWMPGNPWYLPRFAPPAATLARHGFFGNATMLPIDCPPETVTHVGDQPSEDFLQRLLVLPLPVLLFEIWQRAANGRATFGPVLHVGKPAEILREALPWLALSGYRLVRFDLPTYVDDPLPTSAAPLPTDPVLVDLATPILAPLAESFQASRRGAFVASVIEHLQAGLAATRAALPGIQRAVVKLIQSGQPGILLTSGIYGPIAAQFHAVAREHNVRIIDFEHGATTGIARTSQRRLPASEATTCDLIVVSSDRARDAFALAPNAAPGVVVGLADQTRRVLRRRFQRWRARARMGLSRREIAIVHVSGLVYGGNMRAGDDAPVEGYVYEMERQLLCELYADLPYRVFYKAYAAIRLAYQPDLSTVHNLANNIRIMSREDFRYLRAAADLIVTDAHMSTLGWCFGAGVPVVYLGSGRVNALADDALSAEFSASLITFDTDRTGWIDEARRFLASPPAAHAAAWRDRRAARERFLARSVMGPPGASGRRAADAVIRFRRRVLAGNAPT